MWPCLLEEASQLKITRMINTPTGRETSTTTRIERREVVLVCQMDPDQMSENLSRYLSRPLLNQGW